MMMFQKLLELTIYCECNYPRGLPPPGQAHTHTLWMLQTPKFLHCRIKNSYNADSTISSLQTQQLLHCRLHNFSTADPKTSRSCTPQVHNHLKVAMADDPTHPRCSSYKYGKCPKSYIFLGEPFPKSLSNSANRERSSSLLRTGQIAPLILEPPWHEIQNYW